MVALYVFVRSGDVDLFESWPQQIIGQLKRPTRLPNVLKQSLLMSHNITVEGVVSSDEGLTTSNSHKGNLGFQAIRCRIVTRHYPQLSDRV